MYPSVELWYAPLPAPLSRIAWHHWFVIRSETETTRWEVWQTRDAGGISTGHVHQNLMGPEGEVGGGPAVCLFRWFGEDADMIAGVIRQTPDRYPFRFFYLAWPGPNSNTFVRWILEEAERPAQELRLLGPQAIGQIWGRWRRKRPRSV